MEKIKTVKNERGANLSIGEVRPNTYNDFCGCTVDAEIIVWTDDQKRSISFWLEDIDTGFSGESWMDGYFESELECNPDFNEDMNLTDIYTEAELEERALEDSAWLIMDSYDLADNPILQDPFLRYVNRIEDAMEQACLPLNYGYRSEYREDEQDIKRVFQWTEDEKFRGIRTTDLVDFEAMSYSDFPQISVYHGDERDFFELLKEPELHNGCKTERYTEPLQPDMMETAKAYCAAHDARMLLLPLAVCEGLRDTHFIHKPGLTGKVHRLLNETDWHDEQQAGKALLMLRQLVLGELRQSVFIEFGYERYERFDQTTNQRIAGLSDTENDEVAALLRELCQREPLTIDNPVGNEISVCDWEELDHALQLLRTEHGYVVPRQLALLHVLNDDRREEMEDESIVDYISDDNGEHYYRGLLSEILEEMYGLSVPYRSLHSSFMGRDVNGKRGPIENVFPAADTLADYPSCELPERFRTDVICERPVPAKPQKTGEKPAKEPKIKAVADADGNYLFGNMLKMIRVEGGTFLMGASGKCEEDARQDETPAHEVTLSDYYIAETAVTCDLWRRLMGSRQGNEPLAPITSVTWHHCHKLIRKLNSLTAPEFYFSLPTEAQWEFAARGGVKSQGYRYSGSDDIEEVAWYGANSDGHKHPVARKKPNELGLYDMSGNAGEWCEDEYDDEYPTEPQTNPEEESTGCYKVFRGGGFRSEQARCRVSNRSNADPLARSGIITFRLAMKVI